jgi:hypothetical protein
MREDFIMESVPAKYISPNNSASFPYVQKSLSRKRREMFLSWLIC